MQATSFDDRPEGIARDRWDVAIETEAGMLLVECGAIRERVSQELARAIFDAVKQEIERRDDAYVRSASPLGLGGARPVIRHARHDEQQVGQTVDIAEQDRIDGRCRATIRRSARRQTVRAT